MTNEFDHREQRLREIALAIGSDSGIRQPTAIAFVREGADVAITFLEDHQGAQHTQKMVAEVSQKAVMMQLDRTEPEDVENLFSNLREALGTPTSWVNNAGIDLAGIPVKDLPYERWVRAVKTNLYDPFLCCQEFI